MSNYNNELHKHKTADTIKWIVVFVLLIAIIGAVVCLGLQAGGVFDKIKDKNQSGDETADDVPIDDSFVLTPSDDSVNPEDGLALAFVASAEPGAVDDGYRSLIVTAKVGEIDVKIDMTWTVEFTDPQAEWAVGKSADYYVSVIPQDEYKMNVNVRCLQAFGAEIKITAQVTGDPEQSVSCKANYKRKLGNVYLGNTAASDGTLGRSLQWASPINDPYTIDTPLPVEYSVSFDDDAINSILGCAAQFFQKLGYVPTPHFDKMITDDGSASEATKGLSVNVTSYNGEGVSETVYLYHFYSFYHMSAFGNTASEAFARIKELIAAEDVRIVYYCYYSLLVHCSDFMDKNADLFKDFDFSNEEALLSSLKTVFSNSRINQYAGSVFEYLISECADKYDNDLKAFVFEDAVTVNTPGQGKGSFTANYYLYLPRIINMTLSSEDIVF